MSYTEPIAISYSNRQHTALVESDDDYHVDVDLDKHNTNEWTIFLDWRIVDADGGVLGVAGVGIDLKVIEEIARYYSETFDMDVSFTSADGTAYIGSDQASVTEAHRNVSSEGEDDVVTTWSLDGCTVSRYMPLIGWYLVVENAGSGISQSMLGLIGLSVLLLVVSLAVVAALNSRMFSRERQELTHRANTDPLTSCSNGGG